LRKVGIYPIESFHLEAVSCKIRRWIRFISLPPIGLTRFRRVSLSFFCAPSAKPDMGKPLFKASDGGRVDILGVSEDVTESELKQVSEM